MDARPIWNECSICPGKARTGQAFASARMRLRTWWWARIAFPAAIHYSVVESSHCPARIGRKLFGRAVFAAGAWANS